MKCWSFGLVATLCVSTAGAAVREEPSLFGPNAPMPAASAPAAHAGMFAAGSAPFARRLSPEQREERRFLKDATAAGRFERDAARLALAKSGDTHVRSLAATLLNHHSSALNVLQRALQARNMAPPMLSNEQRLVLNHLAKWNGAKFDREWMEAVGLHSQLENVLAFEKAATTTRDPQLRAWVERTLPTLRYQLQAAERVASGGTKYAKLAPQVTLKAPATAATANVDTRAMGAGPAAGAIADLGEGNMLLGPARPVAVKLTEPNTR